MKALIAGGGGVVGAALAQELERRGWNVIALSRRGASPVGAPLVGDVCLPNLGLDAAETESLRDGLTHVVSCFGSVDWSAGPRTAVEAHLLGTRNLLGFASACTDLERFLHVSSVLVLGRARGRVGSSELDVGQRFRNWYEYGKFLAERTVRDEAEVRWRVVRLGPVLGVDGPVIPSPRHGLLAALPALLRGYPIHLDDGGAFPCYVGESTVAAKVLAHGLVEQGGSCAWTWFDPTLPSLAEVLAGLCGAWGVVPRIVSAPALGLLQRGLARTLGIPRALLTYAEPWVDIDPRVLEELDGVLPPCPDGYVARTGEALRQRASELAGVR